MLIARALGMPASPNLGRVCVAALTLRLVRNIGMGTVALRYFLLTLCVFGCGGAAPEDKKANSMSPPPAVAGGAGGDAAVVIATSGSAGASAGASGLVEGGSAGVVAGGSAGVAADQAGNAGSTASAGGFACGASTCTANQLCVARYCGGGAVQCMGQTDGGCPLGWHVGLCPGGQFEHQSACIADPCTPPAPECIDPPPSCASAPDCLCLDKTSICHGVGCQSVIARQVTCNGPA